MENEIIIQKENILKAYNQASEEQKALLENMFGKDMFQPKDIRGCIKTFDDACEVLGEEHSYVREYRGVANINFDFTQDIIAYLKLRIICAALNEGWEPRFTEDERRWYPWFTLWTEKELKYKSDEWKADKKLCLFGGYSATASNCGLAYAYSDAAWAVSYSTYSARLAVKSEELAEYCGKQFIDIWIDFLFA